MTEQVLYLRGEQPEKLAEKVADVLPELRRLDRHLPVNGEDP